MLFEAIMTNGFGGLLANLATEYLKRKTKQLNIDESQLKTDLSNNLEVAFQKCTKIKTIISDKPVDFLSIYVDQFFKIDGNTADQYDLIDTIRKGKSFVVTGTGGGGKSMFMRYLWLSYFERSEGKIPFFLELRQLNTLTHERIEDFIYHSIIQTRSSITQKNFQAALNQGEFILFFDGFDEISLEMRDKVEQWIIQLKENNPKLTIVMTSRPMDRFRGWGGFNVCQVMPLNQEQVVSLVDKAPFFEEDKDKLKKKIKGGLYKTHREFLSNPLLAYMMLVTISYNPDIPHKMHLFYEMAFDALFHRHDLTKNGYKREHHCKLEKHEFQRIISYFSLITYHEEAYEFTIEEFREYMKKVRSIETINFDDDAFLQDLMESVCLVKIEGLEYSFTHRSFQEYFSAYCISRVANRNIDKIFDNFAHRHSDQVLAMVYNMNVNLFREKYILPRFERYKAFFTSKQSAVDPILFLHLREGEFRVNQLPQAPGSQKEVRSRILLVCTGDFDSFVLNVGKIIDLEERRRLNPNQGSAADEAFLKQNKTSESSSNILRTISSDGTKFVFNGFSKEEFDHEFQSTGMYDFIATQAKNIKKFVNFERREFEKLRRTFDELF